MRFCLGLLLASCLLLYVSASGDQPCSRVAIDHSTYRDNTLKISGLDLRQKAVSLCATVTYSGAFNDFDMIFSQGTRVNSGGLWLGISTDNRMYYGQWDNNVGSSGADLTGTNFGDGLPHHVCFVSGDQSSASAYERYVYIDGALYATGDDNGSGAGDDYTGTGDLYVGRLIASVPGDVTSDTTWAGDDSRWQGTVDNIRVYYRELSAAEVKEIAVGIYNDNTALQVAIDFESISADRLSALDSSGNNRHAAFEIAPSTVLCAEPPICSALAVDHYAYRGSTMKISGLDFRQKAFSLCATVTYSGSFGDFDTVFSQGTRVNSGGLWLGMAGDSIMYHGQWNNNLGGTDLSGTDFGDGREHHVCWVSGDQSSASAYQLYVYIDGALYASGAGAGSSGGNDYTGVGDVYVGRLIAAVPGDLTSDTSWNGDDSRWQGTIDDIRIYYRELGAAEVAEIASGVYNDNTALQAAIDFESISGDGLTAYDTSGNNRHATFELAEPTKELCVKEQVCNKLRLDGSANYRWNTMEISGLDLRQKAFSLCATVTFEGDPSNAYNLIFSQGSQATSAGLWLGVWVDQMWFGQWGNNVGSNGAALSGTSFADGNEHHVCFVSGDQSSASAYERYVYIDGALYASGAPVGAGAGNDYTGTGDLYIGRLIASVPGDPTSDTTWLGHETYWEGTIDDIRIYYRELGAAEVAEIAAGVYNDNTALQVAISFESNSGDGLTAYDTSGNDHHATFELVEPSTRLCPLTALENPLRCGAYDSTNERYFYNDGTGCETTPTVNDACYYSAGDLVTTDAATLRVDLSELKADGGTDYIYLAFDAADKYYSQELVFADAGSGECAHGAWEQVSATRNVTELDACYTTFVYRLPWADAYNVTDSKCGWVRDTSGANVKLVLDFAVRMVEDLSTMRNGTTLTRTSEFSMPVQVEFPVQVTAQTDDVQVFAPVRVIAAIVGQSVTIDESTNPDTATLTLRLSTEVQKPFELHAITSESHPVDVTLATTLDGGNDVNVRKDAECTNSALDCGNEWEWTYTTQTTTEPCDFDGAYSVSFTIRCSDENDSDCPIDVATDSVTITFNVDSSDHCPKVVDSIVLSAALEVFDAPQRVTAADDFVGDGLQDDGQTAVNEGDADQWQVAYFTAPTTSTQVALDTTEFNQVWIIRGDASKVVLLDKDNTHGGGVVSCTATAYSDADDATSCGTEAGLDTTTCQLIVPDVAFPDKCGAFDFAHRPGTSADAGDDSTPWFEFDINTGASGFNMDDDAIETMTVHAVIDVTYTNAAKRVAGSVQETRSDFASVEALIKAAPSTSASTSSTTTSSALFGMNATVLYGAGAFLVVAVLAVLVVISRRRSSPTRVTKLQSSTELATTNAV